jgi:hypothetical protein
MIKIRQEHEDGLRLRQSDSAVMVARTTQESASNSRRPRYEDYI